jgi:hypothetical protein
MAIVVAPATVFLPAGGIGRDTLVYGDSDGEFGGHAAARIFIYKAASSTLVSGDADAIDGKGRGGNDRFYAVGVGNAELSLLYGDASVLLDAGRGGDDRIAGRGGILAVTGDADLMFNHSRGGDDGIVAHRVAGAAGDAAIMTDDAQGGDDRLDVRASDRVAVADAVGDAYTMDGRSVGGDDLINGGWGNDLLYGDAPELASGVTVGEDRFVFQASSGKDTTGDFQRGHDEIDVRRLGVDDIADLRVTSDGTDSVVHFHDVDQVTVLGVANLHARDFLFA